MKQSLILFLGLFSTLSFAGSNSSVISVFSGSNNPASASFVVSNNEQWRVSYLGNLSNTTEIGDVNNFVDDIDELIDILDDPATSQDPINEVLDRFNSTLENIGENGSLKNTTHVFLPGFPVYWSPSFIRGTFFTELSLQTQIRLTVLDDNLSFDQQNGRFTTASAAYLKSGIQQQFAFGYSASLFEEDFDGRLYFGTKLNIYRLELSKQLFQLQLLNGRNIEDIIEDEYENNLRSTTDVGLDIGLLWSEDTYRMGLTLKNINEPSFRFGEIGAECSELAGGSTQRTNCELTRAFAQNSGEIQSNEEHIKNMFLVVDANYFVNSYFGISTTLDLSSYNDIVGERNQIFSITTLYSPHYKLMPDTRLGYTENLTGNRLSSLSAGFTFMENLNIDIEYGLDRVEYEGSRFPRKFSFSIGIEEKF